MDSDAKSLPKLLPGVSIHAPDGALAALIRGKDWSQTLLGPLASWPAALRGYVEMILSLPTPAIIFWGRELVQLYNDGYAVIMGPRHPTYLGATYQDCWPDTYPTIHPWMERVLEGDIVEVDRTHLPLTRHGFNEEAYFTFTFSPLRDDEGRIAGLLQIVNEMTSIVLAERRERTIAALAATPHAHLDGVSDDVLEVLAQNPSDVPVALHFLPDGADSRLVLKGSLGLGGAPLEGAPLQRVLDLAEQVMSSGRSVEVADLRRLVPLPPEDGATPSRPRIAMAMPIKGGPTAPTRGVIVLAASARLSFDSRYREFFQRIADGLAFRLAVKQELFLAEQLKLAVESAKLGTWHTDLRAERVVLSPRAAEFLGADPQRPQTLSSVTAAHIHPDDRPRFLQAWQRAIDAHELYTLEYRILRPDGEVRWLQSWGIVSYDAEGTPQSMSSVSLDITDRKRVHAELQEAIRARDEFISIASHELKTPLTSLLLQTQGLQQSHHVEDPASIPPERVTKLITRTERQTRRLARLVDDMLDVSRINTRRFSVIRGRVDLGLLLQEVVEQMRPQFAAAGTALVLAVAGPLSVNVDAYRIEQVVTNLLTNALRYGNRQPVTLEMIRHEGNARVTVRDHGPGISREDQARIFERFERAVSASEISGLGLGLFISREIIETHGGKLWVDSEHGAGAAFSFELSGFTEGP